MVDPHNPGSPRERGEYDTPPTTPAEDARTIMLHRISWGAVLAGVVVALVTQLVLNLIGIGIGAASIAPAVPGGTPSTMVFSVSAGLWWAVSGILAALAGGYAAGRLAGQPNEATAGWHGLTSWALTTLLIFWLLTSTVGSIVGGAYRTVANAVGGVTSAPVSLVQQTIIRTAEPFARIEQLLRSVTPVNDPAALRDAALAALRAAFTGDPAAAQQARERAAQLIAQAQSIPIEQARRQVEQYEQEYKSAMDAAKRQAVEAAETTAQTVSTGALIAAAALILGAIAAWFGGRLGTIEPTLTNWAGRMVDDARGRLDRHQ